MLAEKRSTPIENHLQRLVDYIEAHLEEPLTLEQLAQVAGYSPFHLHHIFRAYTEESLGSYIRRRRMSRAITWLTHTRYRILDIALLCGYQNAAAFSKIFRQIYHMTPSQVRKTYQVSLETSAMQFHSIPKRRIVMDYEIRILPDQAVLTVERKGLLHKNFNKAADEAFNVLTRFIRINRYGAWVGPCLGITPDDNLDTTDAQNRYIAGYILKGNPDLTLRGEIKKMILPGGRYAVFTHLGPYEILWKTWDQIYHDWLPQSSHTLRNAMPYELYVKNKQDYPPAEMVTEIFIPIE